MTKRHTSRAAPRGRQIRYLYVIILRKTVLNDRRFVAMNSHYSGSRLCLYVGLSAQDPEVRFKQHLDGIHSSRIVRKFGKRVFLKKCKRITSLHETALRREREYAERLRHEGYAVWQN